MTLTRRERRLALAVLPLVLIALTLMLYPLRGPFGSSPVVVQVPSWVIDGNAGEYQPLLPDFVFVKTGASQVVVDHETLHYEHPDWTECQVSDTLTARGVRDFYNRSGACTG